MTTRATSTHGRIVVGVDGSACSTDALRWAARLATSLGVGLDVVTSFAYPPPYEANVLPADWNAEADAKITQDTAVASVFPGGEPVDLQRTVLEGPPTRVLLDVSSDAGMLVLGSRGHGGLVGLLLGSVSAHCVEHARCPVLVVRSAPPVTG